MFRPTRCAVAFVSLSAMCLAGCKTIYSDMYSPRRSYFKPTPEKSKPAAELLPPSAPTTVPATDLVPPPTLPDAAPPPAPEMTPPPEAPATPPPETPAIPGL